MVGKGGPECGGGVQDLGRLGRGGSVVLCGVWCAGVMVRAGKGRCWEQWRGTAGIGCKWGQFLGALVRAGEAAYRCGSKHRSSGESGAWCRYAREIWVKHAQVQ